MALWRARVAATTDAGTGVTINSAEQLYEGLGGCEGWMGGDVCGGAEWANAPPSERARATERENI